jgi:predicted acylesterase/phospholipase RssA
VSAVSPQASTVDPDAGNGRILTFYSYKGGTGRSMLLANVAWLLAAQGKSVLAIDWDLEAPGLHRYFYPFLEDKELAWSDGVINFVGDYKTKAMTPPAEGEDLPADWYVKHADIRQYAVSLQWNFPEGGRLDFVPAGKQDQTYSALVGAFNWEDFYKRLGGSRFLDAAVALMRRHYDYVLIDSRTGVSDTSGICTVKMPDTLVVMFTLNNQSINGAAAVADYVYNQRVAAAADAAGNRAPGASPSPHGKARFNIFPIPTRLEDAQTRKMERRRDYARYRKFARYPLHLYSGNRDDYWAAVPLGYHTFYAYEELLAAFGEKDNYVNSFLASVQRITTYLVDGKFEVPIALPQPRREEILRAYEGEAYEPPASTSAEATTPARAADDVIAGLAKEQQQMARRVLLRLVRVAVPGEAEPTRRQLVPLTDFDRATQPVVETLKSYQIVTLANAPGVAAATVQLAPDVPIEEWQRFRGWIEEEKDFLVWRQGLRAQADAWSREREQVFGSSQGTAATSREDGALLLRGPALSIAVTWLHKGVELAPVERNFIETSLAAETRERDERTARERLEHERRRSEQLEAERRRREEHERGRAHRQGLLGGLLARLAETRPPALASRPQSPERLLAWDVLAGKVLSPPELMALAKKLKADQAFTLARRLLARALADPRLEVDPKLRLRILQESALCTYKDTDLPADERLDTALVLLRRAEDLSTTKNQETLGLAGAVHKRKWEIDNQRHHLEQSLHYYMRGYREDPVNDQGYTGINAAFLLELLARLEAQEAGPANPSTSAVGRRAEAQRIREDIVLRVAPLVDRPQNDWLAGAWWFYTTVAEALFGLGRHSEAIAWLERGTSAVGKVPDWEYQSTLHQLARLALLQTGELAPVALEQHEAWISLSQFFGDNTAAVRGAFRGKVGLALSGGGFRAALYHIGVLARLAEQDVLRHVEVLSCVSGGSIVGAHYYLEVRKLLRAKADAEVTREDYIDIVARIQKDFVAGVQRNVRTRVAAEFVTNLWMTFRADYSRTLRVGELYESEIFSRVDDGEGGGPRWLAELNVVPLGEPETFSPKQQNWRRQAKVPILILNATTLNTGHNWQFTTSWMGEPPGRIDTRVDGNEQLRRMYYWEAPERYRQVRLGHAVAASSCVPGLFEPLGLDRLYEDRIVRLVDGGVCDNQGVSGLLEQDCTVMLVSDGSGQTEAQPNPSQGVLGVPLRANAILQARVREAQYNELRARRRSSLLRGFMFVHLKEDLEVDPVDWVDCPDPYQASDESRPAARRGLLTSYGIAKDVQMLLAGVRTDLDSFSDVEAGALMASGYRMTEHAFRHSTDLPGFVDTAEAVPWDFLAVEQGMKGLGKKQKHLTRLLNASGALAFKVWRLSAPLQVLAGLTSLALVASLVWLSLSQWQLVIVRQTTLGQALAWLSGIVAVTAASALATRYVGKTVVGMFRWRDTLSRIVVGVAMCMGGWLLARLHLWVFDRMFLRMGSIEKFEAQKDG